MNFSQIYKRCPGSTFIKRVYLENYRFIYDGHSSAWQGAVSNIIYSKGNRVWGGLFEITEENLLSLDRYEGYPDYYGRSEVEVKDDNGLGLKAIAYLRCGKAAGMPSKRYQDTVLEGARNCELPRSYIFKFLRIS